MKPEVTVLNAVTVWQYVHQKLLHLNVLKVMKEDLRALNASVSVSQEEHDEVVEIKPMFLIRDYQ